VASARRASLNGGLGQSPQRGPGAEPLVGGQGVKPPEAEKVFVNFHTKKWPKVKDLHENLPPYLRQTVLSRHDQP